ncbi:pyridoxamine 5'-phosphate oxidase family protein [Kutzneria sp. CA-103260]|uniref:pyridoxamine 5'-phosphate oxidase family protein n=1 Tax=Kutzneria sp. CA-103260 TaxID=2802641 RepID=UPI001BF03EE3|nr:pyridoxamine 5'-phosphate oxidase family protein [Kutzneria sp. CA-103260]QUQ66412.1 pyridoxamine 5'-phosphate oxidase family protein [Kutzneria sp. CA-103260]
MSDAELDEFLAAERTCRVATTGPDGPHLTALWFLWHDRTLWLTSITRAKRWAQLKRNPQVSVLVDAGHDYAELRGAELRGDVEFVGEAPRTGENVPELAEPERLFARKYFGGDQMFHDGRHAWMRLRPHTVVSWDFRKLG